MKLAGRESSKTQTSVVCLGVEQHEFSRYESRLWAPASRAAQHPVGRLNVPCWELQFLHSRPSAGRFRRKPSATTLPGCFISWSFYKNRKKQNKTKQRKHPQSSSTILTASSLGPKSVLLVTVSWSNGETWGQQGEFWHMAEALGTNRVNRSIKKKKKKTGHRAEPQGDGSHAPFAQASQRHHLENLILTNDIQDQEKNFEMQSTWWWNRLRLSSASFKQIATTIHQLGYITVFYLRHDKITTLPVAIVFLYRLN